MCKCDFGKGLSVCHCAACCRTFTSPSAFACHQRIPRADDGWGLVECQDPEVMTKRNGDPVFMAYRITPDGSPVWGWHDKRSKVALFNSGARQGSAREASSGR